ncbi:MAG: hypothetical protein DWI22_06385 [Planctomycetota bacterium]|nr:MAG: hypothetical protein DWI22_06385 [Planctomycetota bacterium]
MLPKSEVHAGYSLLGTMICPTLNVTRSGFSFADKLGRVMRGQKPLASLSNAPQLILPPGLNRAQHHQPIRREESIL